MLHMLSAALGLAMLPAAAAAGGAASAPAFPVCVSKPLTTPPFARRGKPPGFETLSLCSSYQSRTCCDRAQTDTLRAGLYQLSRNANGSDECVSAWLTAQCSVCHPESGVAPDVPVCKPVCDKLHAACQDAYFSLDATTQMLSPCRERDTVCTRLGDWSQSGSQTCVLAGFAPKAAGTGWCFDGRETRASSRPPAGGAKKAKSGKHSGKAQPSVWEAVSLRQLGLMAAAMMLVNVAYARLRHSLQRARRPGNAREAVLKAAERRMAAGQ